LKSKQKFYVVWEGRTPGLFHSWEECRKSVEGFKDAKYKSFETEQQASKAMTESYIKHIVKTKKPAKRILTGEGGAIERSICVDAACSVQKQIMEYRGVFCKTEKILFHKGPFQGGSNNIGEFLAIVHALSYLKKNKINYPVYTDSVTAMSWVNKKQINTKIETGESVQILIDKALEWLHKNNITQYTILKWNTEQWGEIPADFGRK